MQINKDYIAEARHIGADLRRLDLVEPADLIDRVIAEGATGTEIAMGLRWALNKIAEQEDVTASARERAGELVAYLDQVLA